MPRSLFQGWVTLSPNPFGETNEGTVATSPIWINIVDGGGGKHTLRGGMDLIEFRPKVLDIRGWF
jgi:hypothetical protein